VRVYRIEGRSDPNPASDIVDYVVSYIDQGRLGDTHPEVMREHTSVRASFSEIVYDAESLGLTQFRVVVNLVDAPFAIEANTVNLPEG
jgi:hypothetical protein